jgi:hypothetical protein
VTRKTALIEYLETNKRQDSRIHMMVGPWCVAPYVRDVRVDGHKLSPREVAVLDLSVPHEADLLKYLQKEQQSTRSTGGVIDGHPVPDAQVVDALRVGTEILFSLVFTQETHPDQLYHENNEERMWRERQREAGIPQLFQTSTWGSKR